MSGATFEISQKDVIFNMINAQNTQDCTPVSEKNNKPKGEFIVSTV